MPRSNQDAFDRMAAHSKKLKMFSSQVEKILTDDMAPDATRLGRLSFLFRDVMMLAMEAKVELDYFEQTRRTTYVGGH